MILCFFRDFHFIVSNVHSKFLSSYSLILTYQFAIKDWLFCSNFLLFVFKIIHRHKISGLEKAQEVVLMILARFTSAINILLTH